MVKLLENLNIIRKIPSFENIKEENRRLIEKEHLLQQLRMTKHNKVRRTVAGRQLVVPLGEAVVSTLYIKPNLGSSVFKTLSHKNESSELSDYFRF